MEKNGITLYILFIQFDLGIFGIKFLKFINVPYLIVPIPSKIWIEYVWWIENVLDYKF